MEKHVLILTTTHDFLGKFELENVRILQQLGYTVHYASNMNEPQYMSDRSRLRALGVCLHHIDVARSPFLWKENRRALRQILHFLRIYHIQMIHCHTPVGGVLGRLAGHLFPLWRVYVIYTAHGFHFYRGAPALNWLVYYQVERYLARYTDDLIVINEEDYRTALHFRLRKGGSVFKIPGAGLDREKFQPQTAGERAENRKKLGIGPEEFFLVSVGELNGNKNHEVILEALKLLRDRKRLKHLRCAICGDGFYRERLEEKIRQMNLGGTVELYGYRRNIPELLGCADASIFPSRREGLGMAGLESLALGVPVIAADNRGTREYMEHGKNGYVCRYDDAEGFAQGIERMQQLEDGRRREMSLRCTASVKPFDKAYAAAMMRRIYEGAEYAYEEFGESQYYDGSVQSG